MDDLKAPSEELSEDELKSVAGGGGCGSHSGGAGRENCGAGHPRPAD